MITADPLTKKSRSALTNVRATVPGHFGVHLTIDGYGGDPELLDSQERVFDVLNSLPDKLNMRKIMKPHVVRAPGNDKKDPGGVSGFVMIAESHISIHTFPRRRFVSIDVYTCQNQLPTATALAAFTTAFGLSELEVNTLKRGKQFARLAKLIS